MIEKLELLAVEELSKISSRTEMKHNSCLVLCPHKTKIIQKSI